MFTRNPCIKTVLISTIKTQNTRGLSIPGTISTSGFVSYCFCGKVSEVYLNGIEELREQGFISLESEESDLKGKSIAEKILPHLRTMDHFELGPYLKELQISTKTKLPGFFQSPPKGWLTPPGDVSQQETDNNRKPSKQPKFLKKMWICCFSKS